MPPGALDGLLVADFSRVLAGPLCTMTLGDLGADVVKVERPEVGDDTRGWGASYFPALNRNKRSVALDLADPDDRELARELALRADVLVESFRPGLMESWGLGLHDLRAENPKLVTCSVTAFGSGASLPGYDLLAQAAAGWMSITGDADGPPRKIGAPLADVLCGLHATVGVLAALQAGGGRHVEVSLMHSALAGLINQGSAYLNEGTVPGRLGNRHPSITPYETFAAADGDIVIACGNDAIYRALCDALERPDLASDARFARNDDRAANRAALLAELEPLIASRSVGEWLELLVPARVPAGPVNDLAAAFALADELGLGAVDETGGVRTVAPPFGSGEVRLPPPALDEHGDEIRSWLRAPGGSSSGA